MKNATFLLFALAAVVLVSGCTAGLIYTHTWTPLTLDMHDIKVVPASGAGDVKHVVLIYPPLSAAWDDAAIGDIAKKNGLHELYFADLEYFSVLRIWNQYTVHVYGK
ncbi:MAG: hypothetical protein M0Z89_07615 [Nitrospiraceae bacterium]|nr:hypothetical protein [Nitrospiraceae bacterium]